MEMLKFEDLDLAQVGPRPTEEIVRKDTFILTVLLPATSSGTREIKLPTPYVPVI